MNLSTESHRGLEKYKIKGIQHFLQTDTLPVPETLELLNVIMELGKLMSGKRTVT
jgi:hypothetical protein